MAEDLRRLDRWVTAERWPHVACPVCLVGHLTLEMIEATASERTERAYRLSHDPMDLSGTFRGLMRCAIPTCRETVSIVGDYTVDVDFDDDGKSFHVDIYRLRFATPPLKIIAPPADTPDTVIKAIDGAAAVIWTDPSAAANRLRVAIEELLTAYSMRRFRNVNGKRERLTTHARIKEFGRYESRPAETLEAVKWIGNQGSHDAALTATDVLEGAELLGFALRDLYDKSEEQMERRVRAVNKRRGLPRKKNPT